MALEKLSSTVCRVMFAIAFLLLAAALAERLANQTGYTILRGAYGAGRLVEFAGILVLFVMALLLRQIRDSLKKT